MKTKIFILALILIGVNAFSQESSKPVFKINTDEIRTQLRQVEIEKDFSQLKNQAILNEVKISLPDPNAKINSFSVIESPVMSDELSARFPEIKAYRIYGDNDLEGALTVSPSGIHVYYFTNEGNVIISVANLESNEYYVEFEDLDHDNIKCETEDGSLPDNLGNLRLEANTKVTHGTTMRTYKIAIITTAEFYAVRDNSESAALADVTSMVNAIRVLYEKSFAISFQLVATKFFDNNADAPLSPTSGSNASYAAIAFYRLGQTDPANFGIDKYDIGHVFHDANGGGVAGLSTVCDNGTYDYGANWGLGINKARAHSGIRLTYLSTFFHEVGHQLSSHHTFNGQYGSCTGTNYFADSAFEPGSGNTLMSYWGSCRTENIPGWVDRTYFHSYSLMSIADYTTSGLGATCGTTSSTGNSIPNINLNPSGASLKIPKGTPFKLEGSGTHPKGYTLYYNWEQYDTGTTRGTAKDAENSTDSPIFRSFDPSTTGNTRIFPELDRILIGNKSSVQEALPQVARNINMRFTARDDRSGGGVFASDQITVEVVNAGPFLITSQNTPTYWKYNGTNKATITWSVNNTNKSPLNISKVRILLSKDGGKTFPITLANNINNNGSYTITIPNESTTKGRIKIEPMGNHIFFDINNVDITIGTACETVNTHVLPTSYVTGEEGSSILDLDMVSVGPQITAFTGTLSTSIEKGNLLLSSGGDCYVSGGVYYNTHQFNVVTPGIYTFTGTDFTFGTIMALTKGVYDHLNPCENFAWSNGYLTSTGGVTLYNSISATLQPGNYTLIVSNYSQPNYPPLPATYTISITSGDIYEISPDPNSHLDFTFIVKSSSTQKIVAFSDDTDLTNSSIYTPGEYAIYGLAYGGGTDLSAYVGDWMLSLETAVNSGAVCGQLSSSARIVNITGPCPDNLTLSGNASNGQQFANKNITSTQIIKNGQDVSYSAGKAITLNPKAGSGFLVEPGAVFLAEIGGCQ